MNRCCGMHITQCAYSKANERILALRILLDHCLITHPGPPSFCNQWCCPTPTVRETHCSQSTSDALQCPLVAVNETDKSWVVSLLLYPPSLPLRKSSSSLIPIPLCRNQMSAVEGTLVSVADDVYLVRVSWYFLQPHRHISHLSISQYTSGLLQIYDTHEIILTFTTYSCDCYIHCTHNTQIHTHPESWNIPSCTNTWSLLIRRCATYDNAFVINFPDFWMGRFGLSGRRSGA